MHSFSAEVEAVIALNLFLSVIQIKIKNNNSKIFLKAFWVSELQIRDCGSVVIYIFLNLSTRPFISIIYLSYLFIYLAVPHDLRNLSSPTRD